MAAAETCFTEDSLLMRLTRTGVIADSHLRTDDSNQVRGRGRNIASD